MSNMEIEEISDEIRSDFEEYIEAEREKIRDDVYEEYNVKKLEEDVSRLERENSEMKERVLPSTSLRDVMALQWLKENWEWIIRMEQMNKSGKELYEKLNQPMSIDANAVLEHVLLEEVDKVAKHKRIVLVGKAASGKDFTRKKLEEQGFKYAVSYTTRPPRDGEQDGKDYFFLSVEEFEKMISNDEFYEYVTFNGWYYGTSNKQFYEDDIFIMTPYGVSKIHENDRKRCFIMYFDIEENVRRERLALRSDADKVDRRLAADAEDFKNFSDFDIRITNPDF